MAVTEQGVRIIGGRCASSRPARPVECLQLEATLARASEIVWCQRALAQAQRIGWAAGIAHYTERLRAAREIAKDQP